MYILVICLSRLPTKKGEREAAGQRIEQVCTEMDVHNLLVKIAEEEGKERKQDKE